MDIIILKCFLLDPLLDPPLNPPVDPLMDPLLDPILILEPLLDAHDFLCKAEQSNMGMLLFRKSSILGCYNVTKQDVLLLLTIRYLIQYKLLFLKRFHPIGGMITYSKHKIVKSEKRRQFTNLYIL